MIIEKERFLLICDLCRDCESLNYSKVSEALEITEDDVEDYIVKAFELGIIDGRLDDLNQKILIR